MYLLENKTTPDTQQNTFIRVKGSFNWTKVIRECSFFNLRPFIGWLVDLIKEYISRKTSDKTGLSTGI